MTTTSIERMRSLADVGVEDIALVGNKGGHARDNLTHALTTAVQRLGRRSSGSTSHAATSAGRSPKGSAAEGVDREGAEK